MTVDHGPGEGRGTSLVGAGEEFVAGEELECAVELHRAEPALAPIDLDRGERNAAASAKGTGLNRIARKTGQRPEAPSKRRFPLDIDGDRQTSHC